MAHLEQLIVQLQQKDVNAFEKLHQMYAENIRGAINVIVQNEEVAKEICQDVFLIVWQKAETYNASKGRFFTWLLNIARNKAIDFTRSRNYKEQKKNQSLDFFVNIYEESEDQNAKEQKYRGLKQMLQSLKKKCVELLEALYFKGYTQVDASEMLSIPLGTVKSRNRNCLKELRKHMNHGE
ncbi:MAG: RNA polymerase subunit sigma-70 [Flavobacteriaceae bacterium]|nr:RNA polymerase subunit sigma-70 [Flavobacteriaceae bacterium]|tara:strand:+ start:459417 stop:459959 length:543 start_codon:yes stop_codon:yes gene_type:complete